MVPVHYIFHGMTMISSSASMLFVGSSRHLPMIHPLACYWRSVIALQVYLETWWFLWVHWVLFVTYPNDLLPVYVRINCLLGTKIFILFCVITMENEILVQWFLRKFPDTTTMINSIMSRILVSTPSLYTKGVVVGTKILDILLFIMVVVVVSGN